MKQMNNDDGTPMTLFGMPIYEVKDIMAESRKRAIASAFSSIMEKDEKFAEGIRDVVAEQVSNLALAATWPELFGEWDRDKIVKSSHRDMQGIVTRYLLFGGGSNRPAGLLKSWRDELHVNRVQTKGAKEAVRLAALSVFS